MQEKPPIIPADVAAVDAETSADEYTKGLPKRGARKIATMVLGAVAVLALFFTSSSKPPKPVKDDVTVTRPDRNDIASQLKAAAGAQPEKTVENAKPGASAPLTTAAPPFPPSLSSRAPGSLDSPPKMSAEEIAQAKREKAAASPMDANEVAVNSSRQMSQQPQPVQPSQAQLLDQASKSSAALVDKIMANNKGNAAGGRKNGTDESFLDAHKDPSFDDLTTVQSQRSDPALAPGTIIRLVLMRGINTDSPGQITAQVVSNVYDSRSGRRLLIPMGSRVIGVYSSDFAVGQRRVIMAMTRLDMPNGTRISLSGSPAADEQGYSGLPGDVDNHYLNMFGTSLMVGFASMLLPKDQQTTTSTATPSGNQTSGTVLGSALNSTVTTLAERSKLTKPTATIEPGTTFSFSTTKEVLMREYQP